MKDTCRASQEKCILVGLNNGMKLTPLMALELYGCLRLGPEFFPSSAWGTPSGLK